jgi:SulP family sulfate permease
MRSDGRSWDEIGEENIFGNIDDSLNRAREILGLLKAPCPVPFVPVVAREKKEEENTV